MMIVGSQARMMVGRPFNLFQNFNLVSFRVFRFSRLELRPRAPRISGANSEGLPGAVRGNTWLINHGNRWKDYPVMSQLPGVAEWELRVTQMSFDIDQVIYQAPFAIVPQRYIGAFIWPDYAFPAIRYVISSLYIEESPHVIDVARDQPVDFTGYSNGGVIFPDLPGSRVHAGLGTLSSQFPTRATNLAANVAA